MTANSFKFDVSVQTVDKSNVIHMLNIEKIDGALEDYLNHVIGEICEGYVEFDLMIVKTRLKSFFSTKSDSTTEIGAIAEFFCHSYIKTIGYKQEFLFENLEEGSIKKGFDGYYTCKGVQYIFESKSGSNATVGICHKDKIKEAFDDLRDKLIGKGKNNPWRNAYSHASQMDVGTDKAIRKQLKQFSNDFTVGKYIGIENAHVMPGSTIFFEGAWEKLDTKQTYAAVSEVIKKLKCQSVNAICVNKCSKGEFLKYLER